MSWTAVWTFIKRVPVAVWLGLGLVLSLGWLHIERKKRKAAEATTDRVIEIADKSIVHLAEVNAVSEELVVALDAIEATHQLEHAAIDAEGQQPGESSLQALNRLRKEGKL